MPSVGRDIPHDSAAGHVSGESMYVDDLPRAEGELVVDFLASPVSHGRVRSLDVSDAAKVPGVVGLYTWSDLAHNRFGPILKDEILLAEDLCTFMGQPIVVIGAETRSAAQEAKRAIRLDIEELAPVLTIDEAISRRDFIGDTRTIQRGDVAAALASAEHVLEGTFVCAGQDHFYLESQAAIVYPGEHGTLTIHSSTQHTTEVQEVAAHLLGIEMKDVVCVTRRMGGAFGGKECQATHPAVMAALVAQKTRRPARLVYDKDLDMQATGKRHPFQNRWKVGFRSDGRIVALEIDLYSDGGAFADLSTAVMGRAMTHADNAYYLPAVRITGTVCRTNFPPNTAFRGFGGPQGVATTESILEEIAATLGIDALDVRIANCYGVGERDRTPYDQLVENNTLPRLFAELTDRCDYRRRMREVEQFNRSSKTHVRGLSMTAVKFGISFNTKFLNQASALVNVFLDGTVQVSTGATEMGQGVNTKIRQLVADELGIAPDSVVVMITSTEKSNNSSATAASSGADLNGSAAVNACRAIRERMAEVAAALFAEGLRRKRDTASGEPRAAVPQDAGDATRIVFEDGFVFDPGDPDSRIGFPDLVHLAYQQRVSLGERGFYATQGIDFDWATGRGNPFLYFTMGTAAAEVLIDRFTGQVEVVRADVLMDIGKPINPGIDRGQITGGFVQGMGWVTTEELRYAENGELLSHSPTTYKIPGVHDLPAEFHVDWIENDTNVKNVRRSKASNEPPLLTGISVWCAVKHALSALAGGRPAKLDLPASTEQVLTRITEIAAGRPTPLRASSPAPIGKR